MDTQQYAATAEFYDYVVPYQTRPDVAFFVEAAQASGGPVLPARCGFEVEALYADYDKSPVRLKISGGVDLCGEESADE